MLNRREKMARMMERKMERKMENVNRMRIYKFALSIGYLVFPSDIMYFGAIISILT